MLLDAFVEPGRHHHNRENHLVFVLLNAGKHGLNRVEPEPYTCDCGATLTPEVLDRGDESKTSWPNCKSWRNGGKKKCPVCDEYPSIGREQHFRAKGYEATPKSEIKSVTSTQRESALEESDHTCVACSSKAEYVKRIIPPRYGGSRDTLNLAPLCDQHFEGYGHMFVDVLHPEEWYQVHELDWREYVEALRTKFEGGANEQLIQLLAKLLEKGQSENPYSYIH